MKTSPFVKKDQKKSFDIECTMEKGQSKIQECKDIFINEKPVCL